MGELILSRASYRVLKNHPGIDRQIPRYERRLVARNGNPNGTGKQESIPSPYLPS